MLQPSCFVGVYFIFVVVVVDFPLIYYGVRISALSLNQYMEKTSFIIII